MKRNTKEKAAANQPKKLVEVVVPLGDGLDEAGDDGLFDDCPVCQEMRLQIALGAMAPMSIRDFEEE